MWPIFHHENISISTISCCNDTVMLEQACRAKLLHADLFYNSGATVSMPTEESIKLLLLCMPSFTELLHVALCWSYVQVCRCNALLEMH